MKEKRIDEMIDEFDDDMRESIVTLNRQIDPDNFEDAEGICWDFADFYNNSLFYYGKLKHSFMYKEQRPRVPWSELDVHKKQKAIDFINDIVSGPDEFIDELVNARLNGAIV